MTNLRQMLCTELVGVGQKIAEHLAKCNIHNVQDLLFHLPYRYQDRTRISAIADLKIGDQALIEGVVDSAKVHYGRRRSLNCKLRDPTGIINLRFFHFNKSQQQQLTSGIKLRCFGEVRQYPNIEMIHPEYRCVNDVDNEILADHLTPIYPTTAGLSQNHLRKLIKQALRLLNDGAGIEELLPSTILAKLNFSSLTDALRLLHQPPPDINLDLLQQGLHPLQKRLVFEELLAHHLGLRRIRQQIKTRRAPAFTNNNEIREKFLQSLPFTLTAAQQRVIAEITADLAQAQPMLRLVQGDVGCGKTIVAAIAMLQAVASGYQAVLMAPTELLAEQHYRNFMNWLQSFNINLVYLSGKTTGKAKAHILQKINNGEAQIVIGTHALFQKQVTYQQLGLIIVDEQHRFGVEQRAALHNKGQQTDLHPHSLVMTATPIPRTLAMAFYADLDTSSIDELPPGRQPVTTVAIGNQRRQQVIERVKLQCQQRRQAYWVCTLIDESESLQAQAAEASAAMLKKQLPELKIGLVHGRMQAEAKDVVMQGFKSGEFDMLVATTVIEVGVDVANASLMIIENPERLGLAQLHQLRGRVGRGSMASHCVLLYQEPLTAQAKQRLTVLRETNDGFVIAQKDLDMRGPGEILGTRQAGLVNLKIADLIRDQYLFADVQRIATLLLSDFSEYIDPLLQRWLYHHY